MQWRHAVAVAEGAKLAWCLDVNYVTVKTPTRTKLSIENGNAAELFDL